MDFFDLVNISERSLELINPSTPEKILTVGKYLRLAPGSRVIDFGCGYGEVLVLWAEEFGISGVGIDVREHVCTRAQRKIESRGLTDRIEIVCGRGADYEFEERSFDAAACIGATFIWKDFLSTVRAMKPCLRTGGRMVVGEPYWFVEDVPAEGRKLQPDTLTENDLLRQIRGERLDLEYMVRASRDDWDRYEAGNWNGLLQWLEENPDHPQRDEVHTHLRKIQDEYFGFFRDSMGWAMYILAPGTA